VRELDDYSAGNGKLGLAGEDERMRSFLSRLFWRAIDPIVDAVELVKCWVVDRLCGPFPEQPADRAIREAGDWRFRDDDQAQDFVH
jgi:hypothetical protein